MGRSDFSRAHVFWRADRAATEAGRARLVCQRPNPIDIKPYSPASDQVRNARLPRWFADWPSHYEVSASFGWSGEFR